MLINVQYEHSLNYFAFFLFVRESVIRFIWMLHVSFSENCRTLMFSFLHPHTVHNIQQLYIINSCNKYSHMFRRPIFHIRLLPHFVFYLRVNFNCLFLIGTYQFMGDYNIYTLHPSLYITATPPPYFRPSLQSNWI